MFQMRCRKAIPRRSPGCPVAVAGPARYPSAVTSQFAVQQEIDQDARHHDQNHRRSGQHDDGRSRLQQSNVESADQNGTVEQDEADTRLDVPRTHTGACSPTAYKTGRRRTPVAGCRPARLGSPRSTGTMGVSEPQVRERRKTSGASLSEFEPKEDGPARSLRSLCGLRLPGFEPISVRCLLVASAPRRTAGTMGFEPTAIGCLPATRTRRG